MYLEIFKDIEDAEKVKKQNVKGASIKRNLYGKPGPPRFAFCECRNHHLVGIIQDQKYYFTDVSGLRMMFPQGHYEDWSSQFWSKGYKEAFELQSTPKQTEHQESSGKHQGRLQKLESGTSTCLLRTLQKNVSRS